MPFLPDPHPEVMVKMYHDGGGRVSLLTIGLQVLTHEHGDPKLSPILPQKAIVFALGTRDNPEREIFDIPVSWGRAIAARIVEMCEAAERAADGTSQQVSGVEQPQI